MDRQPAASVIDKAELPELIHEMTDPRPGGADHLRQVFLIDSGKYGFGFSFLAKMSQQEENPSQALLAGVEKLIDYRGLQNIVTSILGSAAVPAAFCGAGKMPALLENCHHIMQSSIRLVYSRVLFRWEERSGPPGRRL